MTIIYTQTYGVEFLDNYLHTDLRVEFLDDYITQTYGIEFLDDFLHTDLGDRVP